MRKSITCCGTKEKQDIPFSANGTKSKRRCTMITLFDADTGEKITTMWELSHFDREKERKIVKKWWIWAERNFLLRIEEWNRFVLRHSQLTYSLHRKPIWWINHLCHPVIRIQSVPGRKMPTNYRNIPEKDLPF